MKRASKLITAVAVCVPALVATHAYAVGVDIQDDMTVVNTFIVTDTTGDDTAAIQAAIDAAFANPGPDIVSLGPVVDGCYNIRATDLTAPTHGLDRAHALVLKSEPGNELEFDGNDQPMCRLLPPVPASDPGLNPTTVWFKAFDLTGAHVHSLNVHGGAQGNEHPDNRHEYLDFLFFFRIVEDFQFTDSTVTNMYGLCGIGASIQNSSFRNVVCSNPQKAAFNIMGDSFGNEFVNIRATSTGDDALAFNAIAGDPDGMPGGIPHDNVIEGGFFFQDSRAAGGGSLSIRGGNNISAIQDAAGNPPQFGLERPIGTLTSNRDAVLITKSPNGQPDIDEPSFNITLDNALIYYYGENVSAVFIGPGSHDITISNSTITYPGCPVFGVRAGGGAPLPDGLDTTDFIPDGACNTS